MSRDHHDRPARAPLRADHLWCLVPSLPPVLAGAPIPGDPLFGPKVIMPYGPRQPEESGSVDAEVRELPAPTERVAARLLRQRTRLPETGTVDLRVPWGPCRNPLAAEATGEPPPGMGSGLMAMLDPREVPLEHRAVAILRAPRLACAETALDVVEPVHRVRQLMKQRVAHRLHVFMPANDDARYGRRVAVVSASRAGRPAEPDGRQGFRRELLSAPDLEHEVLHPGWEPLGHASARTAHVPGHSLRDLRPTAMPRGIGATSTSARPSSRTACAGACPPRRTGPSCRLPAPQA